MKAVAVIHFVAYIDPKYGNGWSTCGRLVAEAQSYNEDVAGRNRITCKTCAKA